MKVALIGANGQQGTDIQKIFSADDYFSIIPLSHKDIEITDINSVKTVLKQIRPDIVINTSAYHKVDEIENNAQKAFEVNCIAQKNLSCLCNDYHWTVVFFSTDYVFGKDVTRNTPYKESDMPGPLNMYGLSKLAGEYVTQFSSKKHFIIRTTSLFGNSGSLGKGGVNFVDLMVRLGKEKGAANVVNDQFMTPTYTKNLAENLKALLKTDAYGMYHMTSLGQCSWWEFASEIFKQINMKVLCKPVDSNYFKTSANRPKYSVLDKYNLNKIHLNKMRDWKENLNLYLHEKGYF